MNRKRVNVVSQREWDKGAFDFGGQDEGSLNRVIESLIKIRDTIPAEYREKARCEIDSDGSHDSYHAQIEVWYVRPETQAEIEARVTEAQRKIAQQDAIDRAQYERLKRKFEGG